MSETQLFAWPSQEAIADKAGMSVATAKRAIASLRSLDLIRSKLKWVGSEHRICFYQINRKLLYEMAQIESSCEILSDEVKVSDGEVKVSGSKVKVSDRSAIESPL